MNSPCRWNSSENAFTLELGHHVILFDLNLFTFALTILELLFWPKANQHHSVVFIFLFNFLMDL